MNKNEKLAELFGFLIVLLGFCEATEWAYTLAGGESKVESVKRLMANRLRLHEALHVYRTFSGLTAVDVSEILSLAGWD